MKVVGFAVTNGWILRTKVPQCSQRLRRGRGVGNFPHGENVRNKRLARLERQKSPNIVTANKHVTIASHEMAY